MENRSFLKFNLKVVILLCILLASFVQCDKNQFVQAHEENGELFLPDDFEATVVVDNLDGKARHITVDKTGAVYVNLRYPKKGASIAILRDITGDGRADKIEKYGGTLPGTTGSKGSHATAMRIYNGYVYYSSEMEIYRYKLSRAIPKYRQVLCTLPVFCACSNTRNLFCTNRCSSFISTAS